MKKLSILITCLIMTFALVSCGDSDKNTNESGSENTGEISVTLDIDFPDNSGETDIDDTKVNVTSDASALDVLKTYCESNDIKITMDESSESPYVTSIGKAAATDNAGWVFEINDEMIMESADKAMVKDGDKVDWSFESWSENNDGDE